MVMLTVLGSGDAFGSGGKNATSFHLSGPGFVGLVDCGSTTLVRMRQLQLKPADLDFIVISHFHGDHFGGVPFIVIASAFNEPRSKPLIITGPEGVEEKCRALQESMYPNTGRLFDELPIEFRAYGENWQQVAGLDVQGLPVKHSPPSNPHGLRLKWGNKVLAYSGDTEWTPDLLAVAKDSELMICECNDLKGEPPGHLSYERIVAEKLESCTRRLVLTHMGQEVLAAKDLTIERLNDGQVIDLW